MSDAPRVRRSRKEEQQHVRDVLAALGGSADEFDRAHDPSATEASVGSRIAAYSRLARSETAPAEALAARTARPLEPEREPELAPRPARPKRERRRRHRPHVTTRVRHAVRAVVLALSGVALALLRSAAHAIRQTIRLLARFALRVSHQLRSYLHRAAVVFRGMLVLSARAGRESAGFVLRATGQGVRLPARAVHQLSRARRHAKVALPRPRHAERVEASESSRVAEAVLNWVQAASEASTEPAAGPPDGEPPTVEPEREVEAVAAPIVTARPPDGSERRKSRKLPVGLALGAAAVAVGAGGALTLTHGDRGSGAPARSVAGVDLPRSVPSRSEFSDPRKYGAAMSRLALTSGRTQVDGHVACTEDSTWNRWTCRARGKPSLGAYAGVWLTYRCSPNSTPQPGGRPAAVMINCKPVDPPPLSA